MTAVCGLLPAAGDTVILGPNACSRLAGRPPFQAEVVDVDRNDGTLPGFVYLTVRADTPAGPADDTQTYFARIEGLVIHRQP
jgi:hypothetical protein